MNKSSKILSIILVAIMFYSAGGFVAALHNSKEISKETVTISSENQSGQLSEKTTIVNTTNTELHYSETITEGKLTSEQTTGIEKPSTTVAQSNNGGYYYNYPGVNPAPAEISGDNWNLILVNIHYYLPKNYTVELLTVVKGNDQKLDARVAPHYVEMYAAAQKAGYTLTPKSGYRSINYQAILFESLFKDYKGEDQRTVVLKASKRRQPPGCSEHNAGLSMDLCQISTAFENTPEFKWLSENASDYGFILRYAKDKQGITEVNYEPWHWRFVGVETAQKMKASGQCLEEYLNKAP